MAKETRMDREAADRIAQAAARDPESATAKDGFPERADAAAQRNEQDEADDNPEE